MKIFAAIGVILDSVLSLSFGLYRYSVTKTVLRHCTILTMNWDNRAIFHVFYFVFFLLIFYFFLFWYGIFAVNCFYCN